MEKKYHPIVTIKSLIEDFLHRYSIYAAKEQNHHFGIVADRTRQDHHWHPPRPSLAPAKQTDSLVAWIV